MRRAYPFWAALIPAAHGASCSVRDYGAVGNGEADDTTALQEALDDSNCDEVLLPTGGTFASSRLRITRSNLVLTIEDNATLLGIAEKIRRPECNGTIEPEWRWQDWCAFVQIKSKANFSLRGSGSIAPGGHGGQDPDFFSAFHVLSTVGVKLSGIRIDCTAWWWCTTMHNVTDIHVFDNFWVNGSNGRDGMDLVNCARVLIEDARIEGSDDGLCLKTISNGGLSAFPSHDYVVRRSRLSSKWCNALQFGSATEVDMWNFSFEDLSIESARKAGIGIVSMDSANISEVSFRNVSITGPNVATPIYVKLGNRVEGLDKRGNWLWPGSIANVTFTDIQAQGWGHASDVRPGHSSAYAATVEGLNASHRVGPLRFVRLRLTSPGGGSAGQALVDPPISPTAYQPRYTGTRPAWGLFVRHAQGVELRAAFDLEEVDGRPAIVGDDVDGLRWQGAVAGGAACQLALRNVTVASGSDTSRACEWTPRAVSLLV